MALQMLASRKYVLGFVYSVTSGVLRLLHRATGGVLGLALSLLHRAARRILRLIHRIARGVFGLIRRLIQLLRSVFAQIFHFCLTFPWHTVAWDRYVTTLPGR
jgi:hypothetical protein